MAIKTFKGLPLTGARPQNKPRGNVLSNQNNTSVQAQQLIRRPAMPFQSKQGPANIPAPRGRGSNAAQPKAKLNLGLAPGMRKHNAPSVNAHPSYRVSSPKQTAASVGGGMPRTGKGAPAVMNGRGGLLGGTFKATSTGSGRSGAPRVIRGKSAFFGG